MVAWQQVFPTRRNSHLVHIRSRDPKPEEPPAPANSREQIVAEIKARAAADEQVAASQVVEAGELHDANPWLRMTWWARYLAEDQVHYQDLLDVVTTPDPELEDPTSRATRVPAYSQALWKWNLDGRREYNAEPDTIPAIAGQKTWQWLWQMAMVVPHKPQDIQDMQDPRSSPDPMAMDDHPDPAHIQPFIMTLMETTCLEFCINPLVCAMAVLGWGEKAWRDPKSYPPIISWVLKYMDIICMWAAAAEQGAWTGDAADNNLGLIMEDKGPLSSSYAIPIGQIPVDWMVQKFMMRGQYGPMEVLLDWWIFGLKIYYNTTILGHVT
ncbi:hypothetical protein BDV19DRAFT_383447 [Aspergillus venezuelensis]